MTAEFQGGLSNREVFVWVTGLNQGGFLTCLGQLHLGMPASFGAESESAFQSGIAQGIWQLARLSRQSVELLISEPILVPEFRAIVLTNHFDQHESLGNIPTEEQDKLLRIARQYQLAVSLGASTVVEFIAAFNDLPLSTVRKRIERAKASGLIPNVRKSGLRR